MSNQPGIQQMTAAADLAITIHAPVVHYLLEHGLCYELDKQPKQDLLDFATLQAGAVDVPVFVVAGLPLPRLSSSTYPRLVRAVEKLTLGLECADPRLYGLTNHPSAVKLESLPQALEVLASQGFYGPYVVVCPEQDGIDYSRHDRVADTIKSRHLSGSDLIVFQSTMDVIRMVVGFYPQLDEKDGVSCVMVPNIRCDFNNHTGIAVRLGAAE